MKILFFVKTFGKFIPGFIANEINGLAERHEVKLLTCNFNYEANNLKNVEVLEIPFGENAFLEKWRYKFYGRDFEWAFYNPLFGKKVKKIINDFQPDVIHTHFGFDSWVLLKNYTDTTIPIFITIHGFDASHKLRSARYRKTFHKFLNRPNLHPLFVSDALLKNAEKYVGRLPNAQIFFCAVDTNFFKRSSNNLAKTPFTFLQVSNFVEKKGHIYTLNAFAEFLKKHSNIDAKLILAGEGQFKQSIENQCATLNIQPKVSFPGIVNTPQVKALMEQANAFVHHSVTPSNGDTEGLPTVLMEAMSMQLPILSTYHSGIPELVEHGVNGYLVQERDVETYAQQMYDILPWELQPQNREKVELLFEKEKHCLILEDIYENAIE